MKDIIKIALGVAGGLILASIVWIVIASVVAKSSMDEINRASQEASVQMQKSVQELAQKQKRIEAAQRQAQVQAMQEQEIKNQLWREKKAAWNMFFKTSKECENKQTFEAMKECVSIEMRARDKFNIQWAASHSEVPALPNVF